MPDLASRTAPDRQFLSSIAHVSVPTCHCPNLALCPSSACHRRFGLPLGLQFFARSSPSHEMSRSFRNPFRIMIRDLVFFDLPGVVACCSFVLICMPSYPSALAFGLPSIRLTPIVHQTARVCLRPCYRFIPSPCPLMIPLKPQKFKDWAMGIVPLFPFPLIKDPSLLAAH